MVWKALSHSRTTSPTSNVAHWWPFLTLPAFFGEEGFWRWYHLSSSTHYPLISALGQNLFHPIEESLEWGVSAVHGCESWQKTQSVQFHLDICKSMEESNNTKWYSFRVSSLVPWSVYLHRGCAAAKKLHNAWKEQLQGFSALVLLSTSKHWPFLIPATTHS